MSLTLADRLFHSAGAAIGMICHPEFSLLFSWATAIVVLQKNEAGIHISPLIDLIADIGRHKLIYCFKR